MRSAASRIMIIGTMFGAVALGGCATTGSVKRAQAAADSAGSAAQRAQGSADAAGSAANAAGSSAGAAAAAAARAQSTADAAATAAQLAGVDARSGNDRLTRLERKVSYLERHRRSRHGRKAVHHRRPTSAPVVAKQTKQ